MVNIFTVDILSKQWELEDSADVQDKNVNFIEQIFFSFSMKGRLCFNRGMQTCGSFASKIKFLKKRAKLESPIKTLPLA